MLDQLVFESYEFADILVLRVLRLFIFLCEACLWYEVPARVVDAIVCEHSNLHLLQVRQIDESESAGHSAYLVPTVPQLVRELLLLDKVHHLLEHLTVAVLANFALSQLATGYVRLVCDVLLLPGGEGHQMSEDFIETDIALCE